jgi:hypothetical protein
MTQISHDAGQLRKLAGLYIDSFEQVWETAMPVDGA